MTAPDPFASRREIWTLDGLEPPWDPGRPSIHAVLAERVLQVAEGPPGAVELPAVELPDEPPAGETLRWAAGARDGVTSRHLLEVPEGEADLPSRIRPLLRHLTAGGLADLYQSLIPTQSHELEALGAALEPLTALERERLRTLARWLITRAPDRGPVKTGMVLLGLSASGQTPIESTDLELLTLLGLHDELTASAAEAIERACPEPAPLLLRLARGTTGWGRIEAVERLTRFPLGPVDRRWLLTEGFLNSVMDEYLAWTCAVAGELHLALAGTEVDLPLFQGAGGLLDALINGGPAQDIDDYDHAAQVVTDYLRHAERWAETVGDLRVLLRIRDFLEPGPAWDERLGQRGWTSTCLLALRGEVAVLASPEHWRERVATALESAEPALFWSALRASAWAGVDAWPVLFRRIGAGGDEWYALFERARTATRVDQALELAERLIPLPAIATGPAQSLGLGPAYRPHQQLDWVLQALERWPGRGWRFIRAGLQSPVVRNRNFALRALAGWRREQWPEDAPFHLRRCRAAEPAPEVRERFDRLLKGLPLG